MMLRCVFLKGAFIFVFCCFTLVPDTSAALTRQICTVWKAIFNDEGAGEDHIGGDTIWGLAFWKARYAHYAIFRDSDGTMVHNGILNSEGCTPALSFTTGDYTFQQVTWLERTGNRHVVVVPERYGSSNFNTPESINTYIHISGWPSVGTIYILPTFESPDTRVAVVAGKALQYKNTREFPSNRYIAIQPRSDWDWSQVWGDEDNKIRIATNVDGMDHSRYKFIIGHELGHAQAAGANAMNSGSDGYVSNTSKCNCSHLSGATMCFQSLEYSKVAQDEAWAYFYSSALFNNRETTGGMSYFRPIYVGSTPQDAILDQYPPITVNVDQMMKWRVNLCNEAPDTGVLQDWLAFYWNLWTVNNPKRLSVDEITDIYQNTSSSNEEWDAITEQLEASLGNAHESYQQWVLTGWSAGVDNQGF